MLGLLVAAPLAAQDRFAEVEIEAQEVAEGVFMLQGAGGNIGVAAGADGVFLIDDQYAPLTERIRAALAQISDQPVRFVLNTHWHPDHTGGNENLGEAGALVVAHDNVRRRLSEEAFHALFDATFPAQPEAALPVVTFSEAVTFHLNGDTLEAYHVPHAHTDGDAIVHFRKANVVHMGDTYFAGGYPLIDIATGGSVEGVLAAIGGALERMDDATQVIPGHGPLSSKADLEAYRDMLRTVRERVQEQIDAGATLEETLAANLTEDFDARYDAWRSPEQFVRVLYLDLTGAMAQP